ncbi:hypothetical protein EC55P1_00034 [Enterococcus phage EC55P1]|nr:hypothetical protein EC55P1_00034 [Enterococcus phage EC55P1]
MISQSEMFRIIDNPLDYEMRCEVDVNYGRCFYSGTKLSTGEGFGFWVSIEMIDLRNKLDAALDQAVKFTNREKQLMQKLTELTNEHDLAVVRLRQANEKLYKKDHEPLPEDEYAYVEGWDEF